MAMILFTAAPAVGRNGPPSGARLAVAAFGTADCDESNTIIDVLSGGTHVRGAFSNMLAINGVDPNVYGKQCFIKLRVTAPEGWAYRPRQIRISGSARVDGGGVVAVKTFVMTHQQSPTAEDRTEFRVEDSHDWTRQQHPAPASYSDCSSTTYVKIYLFTWARQQDKPKLAASVDLTRFDVTLSDFDWAKC
ncbi:DUF4360 domain-containing protein [Pilimelia terevasa]|nr:DUF4360 domain-containing protein [Pilimelia terevasa]